MVQATARALRETRRVVPALADLHPHRVNGTSNYIWHIFDKLEDLRPILK